MADTPAIAAIQALDVAHEVLEYGRAETIEQAAELRGVDVASVVKTLVVRRGDDDYILVCVSGDRSIAWPKLRTQLGVSRAAMADQDQLVAITGYERGMVTPFGARGDWPVIVDDVVAGLEVASIGGGAHGVAINLAGADLVTSTSATIADVTK